MKYRARYLLEIEVEPIEAADVHDAERQIRAHMNTLQSDSLRSKRLLGVVPADEPWPNTEAVEQPVPRPPRNTPPSGSPGTPTARLDAQIVEARAA